MDSIFFIREGFFHVLDINALDHILFFIAITIVFTIKEWKKALILVSIFTIAHTFTFALSSYGIVRVNEKWVEFLIPITILVPVINNSFSVLNGQKNQRANYFFTFLFGLVHGLGFSSYFRMLLDKNDSIFIPLLEFALGIELVQILIVSLVILLSTLVVRFFKIPKKYWVFFISFLLLLKITPMLINRFPF